MSQSDGTQDPTTFGLDSPLSETLGMAREALYSPVSSGMGSMGSVPHSSEGNCNGCCDENRHAFDDRATVQLPPKITPVSGVLGKGKVVIRPIAFKPVISSNRYSNSVSSMPGLRASSHLSGYAGEPEFKATAHRPYSSLNNSCILERSDSRSAVYSTSDGCLKFTSEMPASCRSSFNYSRGSEHLEEFMQTPSPSDSGIAELEAMLREKDSEISYLRETMEHNEQVIFKVYEEKEMNWQKELKQLKAQFEMRLKSVQQKALVQNYQFQQEKKQLKLDYEELKDDKAAAEKQLDVLRGELESVRAQLEETEWSMCQKTGEIALLKLQLKDTQGDQNSRIAELLALKAQLRVSRTDSEKWEQEARALREQTTALKQQHHHQHQDIYLTSHVKAETPSRRPSPYCEVSESDRRNVSTDDVKCHQVQHLTNKLAEARAELESKRDLFEDERERWLEEKEKVIRYQKQLQLNYVQMYRRNQNLESELKHLTFELEGRDFKVHGTESHC